MYFTDDVLDDVQYGNDIVEVISGYLPLEKRGSNHFGLCPFHTEKTPSFSVNEEKQFYHCFGCGASGNVFGFIMAIENHSFPDAVKLLAERIHYTLPKTREDTKRNEKREEMKKAHILSARYFYHELMGEKGKKAQVYLANRHIKADLSQKFGLGYTGSNFFGLSDYLQKEGYTGDFLLEAGLSVKTKKGKIMDRFRDRLIFPIFDRRGEVIGFGGRSLGEDMPKYLNSPDTFLFNKQYVLYGLHFARETKSKELILVEGYMDVIRLHQGGFFNCAATMGTSLSSSHAREMKKYFDKIILLFDGDEAGLRASLRSIPILEEAGLEPKILRLPNGLDPDDFIVREGVNTFKDFYKQKQEDYILFQVKEIEKKYNLDHVAEEIGFLKEVATLLAELKSPIERQAYIEEVSKYYKVSENALSEEMEISKNNERAIYKDTPIARKKRKEKRKDTKNDLLLSMTLNKKYCDIIKTHIKEEDFSLDYEKKLYRLIIEKMESKDEVIIGELLNYFETPELQSEIVELFSKEIDTKDTVFLENMINRQIQAFYLDKLEKEKEKAVSNEDYETMNRIQKDLFAIPKRNFIS